MQGSGLTSTDPIQSIMHATHHPRPSVYLYIHPSHPHARTEDGPMPPPPSASR